MDLNKLATEIKLALMGRAPKDPPEDIRFFWKLVKGANRSGLDPSIPLGLMLGAVQEQQKFLREINALRQVWRLRLGIVLTLAASGRILLDIGPVGPSGFGLIYVALVLGLIMGKWGGHLFPQPWFGQGSFSEQSVEWITGLFGGRPCGSGSELQRELIRIKRVELRMGNDQSALRFKVLEGFCNQLNQNDREALDRFLNYLPAYELASLLVISGLIFAEPLFKLFPMV
jgi:hypothetical protein